MEPFTAVDKFVTLDDRPVFKLFGFDPILSSTAVII